MFLVLFRASCHLFLCPLHLLVHWALRWGQKVYNVDVVVYLIVAKNFMPATNSGESFLNPISWIRHFKLEVFLRWICCCCCCSDDARENSFGDSGLLIGIEFSSAFVIVVCCVLLDFLDDSANFE